MIHFCTICNKEEAYNEYAKCHLCFQKCIMCDRREKWHEGKYKCPTCCCYYCDKHITIMKEYGNCPGCWIDGTCTLCFREVIHPKKKQKLQ